MPAEVEIYMADLTRIVEDTFRTMLDMTVEPVAPALDAPRKLLTATVQFIGDWKGAVLLQCDLPSALKMTEHLMPSANPSVLDDDVRDSMGEVVNVIGGHLKAVLPPGVVLSTPSVAEGTNFAMHIGRGDGTSTARFAAEDVEFEVTLVRAGQSHARVG